MHGAALVAVGMVLVSAGQPLFTEDMWWHLAMGEAYAAHGPWLETDPTLYTAVSPPAPAAWLADLALHGVERLFGFQGLRVAHVLAVAASFALAWSLLRRASGSAAFASVGSVLFAALAAYRLFQLRPHLFTIFAALLLVRLLVIDGGAPSRARQAAAVALMALWANLHAGFVLGPVLLTAALAGIALAAPLRPALRADDVRRAKRLATVLALGALATLCNPEGVGPHLLYFAAGADTPALELVADEWAPFALFRLPVPHLPPSPLSWVTVWAVLLATPVAVALVARGGRRSSEPRRESTPTSTPTRTSWNDIDPALVGVAVASLVAVLSAVRWTWLALFALLAVGHCARALGALHARERAPLRLAAAAGALLLVPAFAIAGPWPMISNGIQRATYALPYPPSKSFAHAVWFLRDAGVEGNLFNDYAQGSFLGYWLGPRLRGFINGSLNIPTEVMRARRAILNHQGLEPGESFAALLDRLDVDVFFGAGMPQLGSLSRRSISTTTHLEGIPGWKLVFRNLRSAVYLRDDAANRENLQRVADYYAAQGIPFDPERGFEPERILRGARHWAWQHGVFPSDFEAAEAAALGFAPSTRAVARERLASIYALLGLYDRAIAVDRRRLRSDPESVPAARRLLWSLLHAGQTAESLAAADQLAGLADPDDAFSRLLVDAAQQVAELPAEPAAALVAVLPGLTPTQLRYGLIGFQEPEARGRKGADSRWNTRSSD